MSTNGASIPVDIDKTGLDPRSRNTLRLALVSAATAAVAFAIAWPIAFLAPVFAWEYLKEPQHGVRIATGISLFMSTLKGVALGLLIGVLFSHHPAIFFPVEALALFFVYYSITGGANPLTVIWALIGTSLLPMVAMLSIELAVIVAGYLVLGGAVAAFATVLAFGVFPEPAPSQEPEAAEPAPPMPRPERVRLAARSVLVMMPLIFFVYTFQQLFFAITVIIASLISLEATREGSRYMGMAMLKGTVLGGLAVVFVYYVLLPFPEYPLLIALVTLVAFFFATQNYSDNPLGKYWGKGWGTFVIVLFAATSPAADVDVKFVARVIQIFAASAWVILGMMLLDRRPKSVGAVGDDHA